MPDSLTVPQVGTSPPASDVPVSAGTAASLDSAAAAAAVAASTQSVVNPPNPSLRLDAALGIVVIQFRSDNGTINVSIPTAQQLLAYKSGQAIEPSSAHPAHAAATQGRVAVSLHA